MDLQGIIQAVSSVGFPIVACVVMWKQQGELTKALNDVGNTLTLIGERLKEIEDNVKPE